MHKYTKDYTPLPGIHVRQQWYERYEIKDFDVYVPKTDIQAWRKYNKVMQWLHGLSQSNDTFGLIHADFYNNFFIHADGITLFDFDDCHYNWFVYDLAVSLVAVMIKSDEAKLNLNIESFRSNMIAAYLQENVLEDVWFKRLDGFMLLRILSI